MCTELNQLFNPQHKTKCVILCYHSFVDYQDTNNSNRFDSSCRSITIDRFNKHLEWLQKFAEIVSLDNLNDFSSHKQNKKWKVAITFDDGFSDNLKLAIPLLKAKEIPLTWFIATYYVEIPHLIPWWILLDYIATRINRGLTLQINHVDYYFDLKFPTEKKRFRREFRIIFRGASRSQLKAWSESLQKQIENIVDLPQNNFVRPNDLNEASQSSLITIGGHTMTHPNLAMCTEAELEKEIQGGREKLQDWSGQEIDLFAYPYGRSDTWNQSVARVVKEAGFKGAVTTVPGYVSSRTDPYAIPRIPVQPGWDLDTFKFRVTHANFYRYAQRMKSSLRSRFKK